MRAALCCPFQLDPAMRVRAHLGTGLGIDFSSSACSFVSGCSDDDQFVCAPRTSIRIESTGRERRDCATEERRRQPMPNVSVRFEFVDLSLSLS